MSDLSSLIDEIILNEGGYQNNAKDKGNFYQGKNLGTKYGITPEFYKNATGEEPTKEKIKNLTEEEARKLLKQELKYVAKINDPDLRNNVFDMVINSGPLTAAKILQKDLGIEQDGVIGSKTAKAIEDAGYTSHDYAKSRMQYYKTLAQTQEDKQGFLEGWLNRASKYLDPKKTAVEKAATARTFPEAMQ